MDIVFASHIFPFALGAIRYGHGLAWGNRNGWDDWIGHVLIAIGLFYLFLPFFLT